MDPASIAIMTAVSTGVSVLGKMAEARQTSAASKYNAAVASNNAEIERRNADFAAKEGAANAEKEQLRTRATIGAIKASQAAAGVDVGSESAVDVRSSAAELGQLNAITIRSNAARKAYGYQTEAASDDAQAELLRKQSKYDKTSGYVNAAGTLLGQTATSAQAGNYDAWMGKNSLPWQEPGNVNPEGGYY